MTCIPAPTDFDETSGIAAVVTAPDGTIYVQPHWPDWNNKGYFAFGQGLGPRLEDWRTRTGEYPAELSVFDDDLDPPVQTWPTSYVLDFGDGGMFSGWSYSSERQSWSRYD